MFFILFDYKSKKKNKTNKLKTKQKPKNKKQLISEFFRESLVISNLNDPNIVQCLGACLRPPELCLVYEYCSCGDLSQLIFARDRGILDFFVRVKLLADISKGLFWFLI